MKIIKKILWAIGGLLILIQVYRPAGNSSSEPVENGIAKHFTVPADVDEMLRISCYDCHSDNTVYPWYSHLQPIDWWLNQHITDGKRHLNFDQFGTYKASRKFEKLKEIAEQVKEDEMPLTSYTLIHRYAILSDDQKSRLYRWTDAMRDSMKLHYPMDSLQQKK
ncbi:MAG: heme-binding domain-containing protein [Bacteroidota bacterium]